MSKTTKDKAKSDVLTCLVWLLLFVLASGALGMALLMFMSILGN